MNQGFLCGAGFLLLCLYVCSTILIWGFGGVSGSVSGCRVSYVISARRVFRVFFPCLTAFRMSCIVMFVVGLPLWVTVMV